MAKNFKCFSLIACLLALGFGACGPTNNNSEGNIQQKETGEDHGKEMNVTLHECVDLVIAAPDLGNNFVYNVSDTARINSELKKIQQNGDITFVWTGPFDDGTLNLIAYKSQPAISENIYVKPSDVTTNMDGQKEVFVKFNDTDKFSQITRDNIGNGLAILIDGRFMTAPKVMEKIESGNCSIIIPGELPEGFLPEN